jgi:hypothetical protein
MVSRADRQYVVYRSKGEGREYSNNNRFSLFKPIKSAEGIFLPLNYIYLSFEHYSIYRTTENAAQAAVKRLTERAALPNDWGPYFVGWKYYYCHYHECLSHAFKVLEHDKAQELLEKVSDPVFCADQEIPITKHDLTRIVAFPSQISFN